MKSTTPSPQQGTTPAARHTALSSSACHAGVCSSLRLYHVSGMQLAVVSETKAIIFDKVYVFYMNCWGRIDTDLC